MYCAYCGSRTKELTKDVSYKVCRNEHCRKCEITEPPNMMGDRTITYYTELSMDRWRELMNEVSEDSIRNLFDETSELMESFEEAERLFEETTHRLLIKTIEDNNRLQKENNRLQKENKKLKKKIKKLKGK